MEHLVRTGGVSEPGAVATGSSDNLLTKTNSDDRTP